MRCFAHYQRIKGSRIQPPLCVSVSHLTIFNVATISWPIAGLWLNLISVHIMCENAKLSIAEQDEESMARGGTPI
jgi:hypothetical protein